MNEFKLYAEEYYTAKRIANILYRPAIDKAVLRSKERWEEGKPLVVEREDGVHYIYKR